MLLLLIESVSSFRQRNHSIHHHLYLGLIAACATFFFGFMVLSILCKKKKRNYFYLFNFYSLTTNKQFILNYNSKDGIIRPAPLLCTSEECMRTGKCQTLYFRIWCV